MNNLKQKINYYFPVIIFFVLSLISWELIVRFLEIKSWILPAPSAIFMEIINTRSLLIQHSFRTLFEAIGGLTISALAGLLVGAIIFRFKILARTLYPLMVISQTVPIVVLIPLLVIWFGFGILPKLLIVILACFFPVAVNTVDGLNQADQAKINLLKAMGASTWQIFLKLRVPTALPMIFSGLKISATYSVMAAVVAEWMGSDLGLGVFIVRSSNSYLTSRVFAGIALVSLFSIILFQLVNFLEKIIIPGPKKKKEEI
ncbi:binding-protein-dependent transport systems inner membrane component [Halanaerobium praevalens DSM 2228]|uniref:Binding-protein-dependent transport systems inner membrane component n=1 Tax=Halanaerobium praevalens (strain ATCC 33744 / DSM 2228 / GSL) TaxID=572479 RepID=E3DN50_HALPG|nr:binding-protein-dependent transport systems inner membrane component [Halanaerobium praevalens DSM 2228]